MENLFNNAFKFKRLIKDAYIEFGVIVNEDRQKVYYIQDNGR